MVSILASRLAVTGFNPRGNFEIAEANRRQFLEQRLENVDRTHLVLASSKLKLLKKSHTSLSFRASKSVQGVLA